MKGKIVLLIVPLLCLLIFGISHADKKPVREIIKTPNAPISTNPLSQAVRVGDRLYISGQLGLSIERKLVPGGFDAEARQALKNHKAILEAAGFALTDVVQVQVFVSDLKNYKNFNSIYKEFFKSDFPARAVLQVAGIPANGLVEIMMIADRSR